MEKLKDLKEIIQEQEITRRGFLQGLGALSAAAGIYGCGGGGDGPQSLTEEQQQLQESTEPPLITGTVVPGTAPHNCGGRCVTKAYVEDGAIKRFVTDERPDKKVTEGNDPQLRACWRCRSYKGRLYHPGRLKYPMKQTKQRGDLTGFVRISWDEALNTVKSQLDRVYGQYGSESVYLQYSSGIGGSLQGAAMGNLLNRLGGRLNYWGSYSSHQYNYIAPFIVGGATGLTLTPDGLSQSKLILAFGSHFAESIFGTNTMWYFTQAKEAGAKIIYVGPYQNSTCSTLADQWVPIYPGTDVAMMHAMIYVMIDEGLINPTADYDLNKFVRGFYDDPANGVPAGRSLSAYIMGTDDRLVTAGLNADVCTYTEKADSKYPYKRFTRTPKTPEWAEKITGVKASTIRQVAREYANTKPAFLHMSLGIQRHAEGCEPVRMMYALAAVTGQWGKVGSGASIYPGSKGIPLGRYAAAPNPQKKTIPCALWADAVRNPGNSEFGDQEVNFLTNGIKLVINQAGNMMINQHMDTNKTAKLLKDKTKIEFLVTLENFMTPSARYSDIVLPAATNWERNDLVTTWISGESVIYSNKAVEPPGEAKPDYEIVSMLADTFGLKDAVTEGKSEEDWLREMWKATGEPISYEELKQTGVYIFNIGKPPVATNSAIRENGEVDPAVSTLRFNTQETAAVKRSGKIDLYSLAVVDQYMTRGAGHANVDDEGDPIVYPISMYFPSWENRDDPLAAQYPLQVLTNHSRYRSHSTHNNNPYLRELYKFDADGNPAYDADTYGVDPSNPLGGNGLEPVWINAGDAQARGISHRDKVKVFNGRGTVYASANVTQEVVPGVIILHQGSWYETNEDGIDVGGCANTLTNEMPSRMDSGNAQMTLLAEVEKA